MGPTTIGYRRPGTIGSVAHLEEKRLLRLPASCQRKRDDIAIIIIIIFVDIINY